MHKKIVIPRIVHIRKYDIDKIGLSNMLRAAKSDKKSTISDISKSLGVSRTEVEHWFRKDRSFSVPSHSIWFELKELLSISNTDFDKEVMEFIEKEGEFDMNNRFYLIDGISPTVTTTPNTNILYKD